MAATRTCRDCGAELPPDAPAGLCPRCFYRLGLEGDDAWPRLPGQDTNDSFSETPVMPDLPANREFGDYELLAEIGHGGMGIVYRARQKSLDRVVALKLLLFGPHAPPESVKRFRAEAVATAALQHPNIVAIHEVGFCDGQHFIAMDHVEGRSLSELLHGGPLPARCAASYVETIAGAIQYAHEHGILHRDLKPSNILIDVNDQPRVTDFGLAKRLEDDSDLTVTGQVLGSPNYMPPEQASGKHGTLGRRGDVYALGAILFHALTGRPPFLGEGLAQTMQQVLNTEPLPPRTLNPAVPTDLETICLKCLQKDPDKRYATARMLAEELSRFLRQEPILARPLGRSGKLWRWCRRKPAVAALSVAVFLLVLMLAVGGPLVAIQQARLRADAEAALSASRHNAAHVLQNGGDTAAALTILERAVNRFPDQPQLWNVKGLLLEQEGRTEEAVDDLTRAVELIEKEPGRTESDLNGALLARCRVLKSLDRFLEAGRDFCRVRGIPLRDASAPPTLIDLSLFYDAPLTESLHLDKGKPGNDLAGVPRGLQAFAGVRFDVRGVVSLNGEEIRTAGLPFEFPQAATNIPVRMKLARLHCLLGTGWSERDGAQIGSFVLRYSDGRSEELPIRYGIHVRDCIAQPTLADDDRPLEHGEVVWTGMNDNARRLQGHLRLYVSTWQNPRPSEEVSSVDFVSTMTHCAPFLIAMTMDP